MGFQESVSRADSATSPKGKREESDYTTGAATHHHVIMRHLNFMFHEVSAHHDVDEEDHLSHDKFRGLFIFRRVTQTNGKNNSFMFYELLSSSSTSP